MTRPPPPLPPVSRLPALFRPPARPPLPPLRARAPPRGPQAIAGQRVELSKADGEAYEGVFHTATPFYPLEAEDPAASFRVVVKGATKAADAAAAPGGGARTPPRARRSSRSRAAPPRCACRP